MFRKQTKQKMTKENYEALELKAREITKNFDNYTYEEVEIILEEVNRVVNSVRRKSVFKEI